MKQDELSVQQTHELGEQRQDIHNLMVQNQQFVERIGLLESDLNMQQEKGKIIESTLTKEKEFAADQSMTVNKLTSELNMVVERSKILEKQL